MDFANTEMYLLLNSILTMGHWIKRNLMKEAPRILRYFVIFHFLMHGACHGKCEGVLMICVLKMYDEQVQGLT